MTGHTGKRQGAGRKNREPTKHLRIPVRFEKEIKEYIELLKAGEVGAIACTFCY
jgi:hypothetical protein